MIRNIKSNNPDKTSNNNNDVINLEVETVTEYNENLLATDLYEYDSIKLVNVEFVDEILSLTKIILKEINKNEADNKSDNSNNLNGLDKSNK